MGRSETHEAYRRRDVALLVKQLYGGDAETRSLAAHYLGHLRSVDAVPALTESLDDPSESVRMSVLHALARIGDRRAIARVAEVAENDQALSPSSRATDVLAQLGDPRAIPQFVSLLTETDRHLANGRDRTWVAKELQTASIRRMPYSKVKWRMQKWAARRLVELRARDAAPAVKAAAVNATSRRERFLLRRTAWRLRHPPRRRRRLRGYLWWWAVLLAVFVLAAKVSGNGSTAWTVTRYFGLTVVGLALLIAFVGGLLELRDRQQNRDG